jgi:hypothetical protein
MKLPHIIQCKAIRVIILFRCPAQKEKRIFYMSQNKSVLILSLSLLLCNTIDAMKRQREDDTQLSVAKRPCIDGMQLTEKPIMAMVVEPIMTTPVVPKIYWDGGPYDGSMIIKPTIDHHCNHCNKWIVGVSLAAHAVGKHSDIYKPQKRLLPLVVLSPASFYESNSFSLESADSSEEMGQEEKPLYVEKTLKNGRIVEHERCAIGGCKFTAARVDEMRNHEKLHQTDNCLICKICDFRASIKIVFTNHSQTHLPKEERSNRVMCSICNKTLSKKSSLDRHVAKKHPEHI